MLVVYDFDPAIYLNDEVAIEAYLAEARKNGTEDDISAAEAVAKSARERIAMISSLD
ncbi:MAG: hypothetical protein U1E50_17415 [Caulobacteraceae bacterium]